MKITSNTIVRDGMPFIDLVLRQVEPFVDEMVITLSMKSKDGTSSAINRFVNEFPVKTKLYYEDVEVLSLLTYVRQNQLEVSNGDWILFLDDDDFWPEESLKKLRKLLNSNEDVDGYSFRPYQVIDEYSYDTTWNNKYFTKLFKNQEGVCYRGWWPRDVIYKGKDLLYWKTNKRVKNVDIPFFHLSNIKSGSFRDSNWDGKYKCEIGKGKRYPEEYQIYVDKIYEYARRNK